MLTLFPPSFPSQNRFRASERLVPRMAGILLFHTLPAARPEAAEATVGWFWDHPPPRAVVFKLTPEVICVKLNGLNLLSPV